LVVSGGKLLTGRSFRFPYRFVAPGVGVGLSVDADESAAGESLLAYEFSSVGVLFIGFLGSAAHETIPATATAHAADAIRYRLIECIISLFRSLRRMRRTARSIAHTILILRRQVNPGSLFYAQDENEKKEQYQIDLLLRRIGGIADQVCCRLGSCEPREKFVGIGHNLGISKTHSSGLYRQRRVTKFDSQFDSQADGLTATMWTPAESGQPKPRRLSCLGHCWTKGKRTHNPEVEGSNPSPANDPYIWGTIPQSSSQLRARLQGREFCKSAEKSSQNIEFWQQLSKHRTH
jgi:hypothetical protein